MKYLSRKKLIFQKKQDSSSLLPIGKMQEQYFTGTEESHTETIEVRSLDDIISDVAGCSLLKIDVQGFELHALKRTKNLLWCFDFGYVECSYIELYEGQALEVINYMFLHKYEIVGVYNTRNSKDGIAIQSDLLFQQRKSL